MDERTTGHRGERKNRKIKESERQMKERRANVKRQIAKRKSDKSSRCGKYKMRMPKDSE